MIDFQIVGLALDLLTSSIVPWLVVPVGIVIGLLFGMIPGLSIPIAMAVFLPFTLTFDFLTAVLFLTAIFTGGTFGTAIPAILMNVPGTAASVATCFDGFPMCQNGQQGEALGIALISSGLGTALGYILLFFLLETISTSVLALGPPELLLVAVLGLFMIAALCEGQMTKGIIAGCIGLMLGTVGISSLGLMRGTLGSPFLLDGIPAVPALIGLFAASELADLLKREFIVNDVSHRQIRFENIFNGLRSGIRNWRIILTGGLIGVVVGAVPGVGAAIANLLSYDLTRRSAAAPEKFGTGEPKGLVAAEAANSSSEAGSMATLLGLGLPGGGATAVMLGAFAMHNITGGTRFIADEKDIVYAIIIGNFVQVFLLFLIGLLFIRISASIVKVPTQFLVPSVLALAALGSFALVGNMSGPVTLVGGAILGFWMRSNGYPVTPMVIGILLGGMVEGELIRTYQLGGGSFWYIFERPIVIGMIIVFACFVFFIRQRPKAKSAKISIIKATVED